MKYATAFELAAVAVRDLKDRGWRFKGGVEREAALSAVPYDKPKDVISAVTRTLEAARIRL